MRTQLYGFPLVMKTAEKLRQSVKRLRMEAGLSVRAIADELGLSPSGYSHYEQRIKEPYLPMRVAVPLATVLEQHGIDPKRAMALAQDVPATTSSDMGGIQRVDGDSMDAGRADLIPVYDVVASAGDGSLVDYEGIAYSLAFPPDYLRRITRTNPKNLTIISVKGDSMSPTLNDDDIVMLDMSKTSLGYEGLFVIRIYDVLHVKRLSHSRAGHVMVISDNRERYPPREYPVSDVEVVGKVLWAGGKI